MNDSDIFKNPCGVCGKRVSTRLCDFIIDYHGVVFFRDFQDFKNQEKHETPDDDHAKAKYYYDEYREVTE